MTDVSQLAQPARRIAFFISPHGFGHAARAAAIMEALRATGSSIHFDIFTTVPDWFFANCNSFAFTYHRLLTDIGLIQKTPFQADLEATIQQLKTFLPFDRPQMFTMAQKLRQWNCELVICDIAPLGIRIASKADVPSILIENFTWDWLYQGYHDKGLNEFNRYLQAIFADATYHIQAQPVCEPGATDLTAAPVSRKSKTPPEDIRKKLGLPKNGKVIMITAGGAPKNYRFIDKLRLETDIHFILPGAADTETIGDNLILLPENSAYSHPDLINAADAVVGKVGYSTIAEIYQAGVPFGYVARPENREMKPLVDFVENHMCGTPIKESDFQDGTFTDSLAKLLQMPRSHDKRPNGADQIAGFIASLLK
jgi:UDP:flavonoid glycosyltransferase YjiC (YdhE family)